MIKFENVTYCYPKAGRDALAGVTLEIPQGSFFALLGPNGAGKTTLLRLLCGRLTKFSGELKIDSAFKNSDGFLDAKSYGVLLENPGVYPKLSVEEYLSYFAGFYGMGEGACLVGGAARARVEMLAERLLLPSLTSRLSTLSLGNRQKVQIARALLHNPKILILDEPVANLDPNAREVVWKLIAEWRHNEGGTAIVCSHILAEMESEATDYAIIDGGHVLATGAVDAFPQSTLVQGFSVNVPGGSTPEQINAALASAGIVATVSPCKKTLADIYKSATRI